MISATLTNTSSPNTTLTSAPLTTAPLDQRLREERARTDRLFLYLLIAQWALAIAIALLLSPYAWAGRTRSVHFHLQVAIFYGALINVLPLALIVLRPGTPLTRHVVAIAQILWSALLIHLTGGRIETHFHIFGSLAFLAFYLDWRVLVTATLMVVADHMFRGIFWPESVYGVAYTDWWRFLEHAAWVVFEDVILVYACLRGVKSAAAVADREASLAQLNTTIESEVQQKTAELKASLSRFKRIVESTNAIPWEMHAETLQFAYLSPQAGRVFGIEGPPLTGSEVTIQVVHPDDRERLQTTLRELARAPELTQIECDYRVQNRNQRVFHVRSVVSVHRDGDQNWLRGVTFDITKQREMELELRQAQKLESVGRLAAGVAHEINTPIQFISDSMQFLKEATTAFSSVIQRYRTLAGAVVNGDSPAAAVAATNATDADVEQDIDYMLEHAPRAIERTLDGAERVSVIVRSMKEFAHPDHKEMTTVDLNRAIVTTLNIARNEYKYVADAETDLGDLPPVLCYPSDINQVMLNMIVNAAHAIEDVVRGTEERGRIFIQTRLEDAEVVIRISDTGGGVPPEIRDQIFDPFFTTKDVGRGTGQGLAIARSVVHKKHHGEILLETEMGVGSTFIIRLPVTPSPVLVGALS
ncbi:MAG: ATP-binding protein [Vicinamibacterales bacterium]